MGWSCVKPLSSESTPDSPGSIEFAVLGRRFRARKAAPEIQQWLRTCWQTDARSSVAGYSIDVAFSATTPWRAHPPYDAVETTRLDGGTLNWRLHNTRWWSTGGIGRGVELRLSNDHARIRAWGIDTSTSPMLLALHVALCEALRGHGLVPLHAAVVERDGKATAILGQSGAGKTSTLLTLLDEGWLPVAEDFALLDPATRRVCGWGGEMGVRLTEDGLRRFSARWRCAAWRHGPEGKLFLPYDAMRLKRTPSAELARVVVLQRDASRETSLEPISPRDAARALWESAGVPLCRVNRDAFALRAPSLVSRLVWARLVLGRGPIAL
jgi:hypothetical protein